MRIGPILALLAMPACALMESGAADGGMADHLDDASAAADGGAGVSFDGGVPFDAAVDAAPSPATDGGGTATPELREDGTCFNGLDDDGNSLADCEDVSCGAVPYCCVGSTSAGCCMGAGLTQALDFGACTGTDPAGCASGLLAFGAPAPRLEGGAFVPNGDAIDDSGMVLGAPVDPTRERIVLRGTIAADVEGCTDCLDALALGLADAPVGNTRVAPDVAVMVRASRRDYALLIAGEPVDSAAIPDASSHVYELSIEPSGTVSLTLDGAPVMSGRAVPRPGRVPLLYGRTHNRDGVHLPARATEVSVETLGCDIPSALVRMGAVIPFAGPSWAGRVATNPSVEADGDERLVAFESNGDVHLARRAADGTWRLGGSGRLEEPAAVAGTNEVLRDPELVAGVDRWMLYVTRDPADGPPTIACAVGGDGFAETFGPATDVTLPDDALEPEAPAVVDDAGTRWMAIRVRHEGASAIALLNASDAEGAVFDWASGSLAGSILVVPNEDITRFDHDEVSDPELLLDGVGLLRLFYAGRRGTRWGIGVRVSGDRSVWREPADPLVLAGSSSGHDRLWARHPSAVLQGDVLTLFYTASNGVDLDIGEAEGRAR
ncbi:MAG: hypothetical protein R3B82_03335 [Sandaracinaceae bacterium]